MNQRKPRSDSRLKTLPPARQDQIADFAHGHSLDQTRTWLAEDGLKTSVAALSEFLSWYLLRAQLSENESTVESVLEQIKASDPDLTEQQLFSAGQSFFAALAIKQQDARTWKRTQDLKFKAEFLDLERKKFMHQEAERVLAEAEKIKDIAGSTSTNSEKIERLGELMFGADWK